MKLFQFCRSTLYHKLWNFSKHYDRWCSSIQKAYARFNKIIPKDWPDFRFIKLWLSLQLKINHWKTQFKILFPLDNIIIYRPQSHQSLYGWFAERRIVHFFINFISNSLSWGVVPAVNKSDLNRKFSDIAHNISFYNHRWACRPVGSFVVIWMLTGFFLLFFFFLWFVLFSIASYFAWSSPYTQTSDVHTGHM